MDAPPPPTCPLGCGQPSGCPAPPDHDDPTGLHARLWRAGTAGVQLLAALAPPPGAALAWDARVRAWGQHLQTVLETLAPCAEVAPLVTVELPPSPRVAAATGQAVLELIALASLCAAAHQPRYLTVCVGTVGPTLLLEIASDALVGARPTWHVAEAARCVQALGGTLMVTADPLAWQAQLPGADVAPPAEHAHA